jgi:hypothetical protein
MNHSSSDSWCRAIGMINLLIWFVGGIVLESFHGLKAAFYLEDALRRQMWTLAHAHGTILSVICLVLAQFVPTTRVAGQAARRIDRWFAVGACLMPLGFWLGGVVHSEADPGLGILLVPLGGVCAGSAIVMLVVKGWSAPSSTR